MSLKSHPILQDSLSPCRALIHVFNNPSALQGYLSWGYLSKKLESFTPYKYKHLDFVILDDPIFFYKVANE